MRTRFIIFLCTVISAVLWVSSGSAEMILTTATGSGADTFLSNDSQYNADRVHGSETSFKGRIYIATRAQIPYFRFDISSAAGTDMSGAILTLYELSSANRARTWNVYGLNDGSGDTWSETTTAYNNAPGILQPAVYNDGNYSLDLGANTNQLTLLGSIALPSTGNPSVPVSVSTNTANLNLNSFLAADTNGRVTLVFVAISSDSTASYSFASKENTGGYAIPTLTLPNAVLIPEPATMVLLVMGGLMMLLRWRRQR